MTNLSESDASALLDDRVKFKLYAAEQELNSLKELEKNGLGISSPSFVARLMWEMKIECLLAHLVGSVDALLIRINDKLGLGLEEWEVNLSPKNLRKINDELKNISGKGRLLDPLNKAIKRGDNKKNPPDPTGWFWTLKDLRNQGIHRKLINKLAHPSFFEDVNTGESRSDMKVYLITNPQTNLEPIPYLEDSYKKTKDLIESIINTDPLLRV
jgi:hypothetical protein